MKLVLRSLFGLLTLGAAFSAQAQTYINFVTCPVVRDIGAEVDVCFYADYQGETYHLSPIGLIDWGQPELKHRLLVEGEVVEDQSYCGGKRFIGRTTVLPDVDLECNDYMPFNNRIIGEQRIDKRPEHPKYRSVFEAMKTDPSVSIQPAPVSLPVESAINDEGGQVERDLVVYFAFNRDRIDGVSAGKLLDFAEAAKNGGYQVVAKSYQAETHLDSGETLAEHAGMAKQRSNKMLRILTGLGIDPQRISFDTNSNNIAGKGKHDWQNRRIELSLE